MNLIPPGPIIYPESDGLPMADNGKQFRWITVICGNLAAMFRDQRNVLVLGDQFWYPVEGQPEVRTAPDVYVVFGRPKGDRGSYKQWEEDNIPMTVVFEVLSPSNTFTEMEDKHLFYEDHGVEEYYIYDPDVNRLAAYVRQGEILRPVRRSRGFVSPRLGIRFDLSGPEMVILRPDSHRFLTFEELEEARVLAEKRAREAEERVRDSEERACDSEERAREAEERVREAEERARDSEERARDAARQVVQLEERADQSERAAARLRELLRELRRGEATPEEMQELDRLNGSSAEE